VHNTILVHILDSKEEKEKRREKEKERKEEEKERRNNPFYHKKMSGAQNVFWE
jgi:hypothetical protein